MLLVVFVGKVYFETWMTRVMKSVLIFMMNLIKKTLRSGSFLLPNW